MPRDSQLLQAYLDMFNIRPNLVGEVPGARHTTRVGEPVIDRDAQVLGVHLSRLHSSAASESVSHMPIGVGSCAQ